MPDGRPDRLLGEPDRLLGAPAHQSPVVPRPGVNPMSGPLAVHGTDRSRNRCGSRNRCRSRARDPSRPSGGRPQDVRVSAFLTLRASPAGEVTAVVGPRLLAGLARVPVFASTAPSGPRRASSTRRS